MWSWIREPGVIEHRGGPPHVTFGPPSVPAERILRSLAAAGIDVRLVPDIEVKTWEKLLFVEPMGSVGAVTRSPVGVFRSVPESRTLLIECQREIVQLARARGVPLNDAAAGQALADVDQSDPAGSNGDVAHAIDAILRVDHMPALQQQIVSRLSRGRRAQNQ